MEQYVYSFLKEELYGLGDQIYRSKTNDCSRLIYCFSRHGKEIRSQTSSVWLMDVWAGQMEEDSDGKWPYVWRYGKKLLGAAGINHMLLSI